MNKNQSVGIKLVEIFENTYHHLTLKKLKLINKLLILQNSLARIMLNLNLLMI